ncbi:MAG: hypothetical protein WCS32_06245 [Candidatus Izemoplasmatales bacterium]
MNLNKKNAEFFIPDNIDLDKAILRTTHMAIGAHQDDLEIMAYQGIEECFQSQEKYFFGIVVTDGGGSARDDIYKNYTNEEMINVRKIEQKKSSLLRRIWFVSAFGLPK